MSEFKVKVEVRLVQTLRIVFQTKYFDSISYS